MPEYMKIYGNLLYFFGKVSAWRFIAMSIVLLLAIFIWRLPEILQVVLK